MATPPTLADNGVGGSREHITSAAPFVAEITAKLLPLADLLVVNEGEAASLVAMVGTSYEALGLPHLIITYGAKGAEYIGEEGRFHVPAPSVKAVNTTGAGDTYLGFLLAQLSNGQTIKQAMAIASKAAGLQVTRYGTADAIPTLDNIQQG